MWYICASYLYYHSAEKIPCQITAPCLLFKDSCHLNKCWHLLLEVTVWYPEESLMVNVDNTKLDRPRVSRRKQSWPVQLIQAVASSRTLGRRLSAHWPPLILSYSLDWKRRIEECGRTEHLDLILGVEDKRLACQPRGRKHFVDHVGPTLEGNFSHT